MAKKKQVKTHEQLVKVYYPNAICVDRQWGNSYKLIKDGNSILSGGKTSSDAWKSAYRNVYGHR